jgi:hypothetical protein
VTTIPSSLVLALQARVERLARTLGGREGKWEATKTGFTPFSGGAPGLLYGLSSLSNNSPERTYCPGDLCEQPLMAAPTRRWNFAVRDAIAPAA